MKTPIENGHQHDFAFVNLRPSDTFDSTQTTLNGRADSDYHDHAVHVFFDRDKKKFIIKTSPGGRTFATQHTHPDMELSPGDMDAKGPFFENIRHGE